MNKFVLLIHGPSCSGKSTLTKLIAARHERVGILGFDKLKWIISDYSSGKYLETISNMTYAVADQLLQSSEGFSLVLEGGLRYEELGGHNYKNLAASHGAKFIEINIEAPFNVLEQRFTERVTRAQEKGSRIAMTSPEVMKEKYNLYIAKKDNTLATFDSSIMDSEEIYNEIMNLLSN